MRPLWSTIPPMSWTSNGRMWTERQAASRATAKAGIRMSSSVAPLSSWVLSSAVLARNSSSESGLICGSSSLMAATAGSNLLTSRSCWLPKILVRTVLIIEVSLGFREDRSSARGKRYNPQSTRKIPPAGPRTAGPEGWRRGPLRAARGRVVEDVGEGVDGVAVDAHLVVQVVAGRAAGVAHPSDDVPPLDPLARPHLDARHVAVAGGDPEAVGDEHRLAEAADLAGPDHHTVRARPHRLARRGGDVHPLVVAAAVGQGVGPDAETAGEDPLDRRDGRRGGDPAHPLVQLGGDRVEGAGERARPALQRRQAAGARLVERRAAADARLGAALHPLDPGDDGELPGALLVLADLVLELLDARLEGEVGPAELLVLALQAGDLDRIEVPAEVEPEEEGGGEREEEEGNGGDPDLEAGYLPLAQLGVCVGDQDDRVVPFCHRSLHKKPAGSWTPSGHSTEPRRTEAAL